MTGRGVVIEFDFTALDGAGLLFRTAKSFLKDLDGIELDVPTEAKYLSGTGYQDGLARLFSVVRTKKTPQKAARDLAARFADALASAVPKAVGAAFKNFVKGLAERGLRVVIATRADVEAVRPAFAPLLGERVMLYQETSDCYGAVRWDSWRRACHAGKLRHQSSLAVTGSGFGVKSALFAGMASMAVSGNHVAYQDFGGADDVVAELSGPTAKRALGIMRI